MSPVPLRVLLDQQDDRARLVVAGDLDSLTREDFVRAAIKGLERARVLDLDLGDVHFVDTVGLSGLVAVNNIATADGKTTAVTACSPQVARLLRLTGLSAVLHLDDQPSPA